MISLTKRYSEQTEYKKAIICCNGDLIEDMLSYKEVQAISNKIRDFLSKNINEKHICICLLMTHNIYIPSIILSLQKLCYCFIFLLNESHDYKVVLEELKINWVLSYSCNLADFSMEDKITLKAQDELILSKNNKSQPTMIEFKNIFCVVATSGTTGNKKYVKVEHNCIDKNVDSLSKAFKITENDIIYFGTPLTFDPSLIELLLALKSGACLLIVSPKTKLNPNSLYKSIFSGNYGVTVLQIVPSLFLRWSQEHMKNILLHSKLKVLAFGGEKFPKEVLMHQKSNNLHIFNLYGITEVSCWAMVYEIKGNEAEIPLGEALDETIVEVRDDTGKVVVEGEGEIFIGSSSRICYIINNEIHETKPVFRATGDLAKVIINKEIFYLTRKNNVIKRFGHKIDLLEIEDLILSSTELQNKCVWFEEKSKLLIFIKIKNFDNNNTKNKILDKVRIKLLHTLPKQHFPDYMEIIREFPLTSHGKIDKRSLEKIYSNSKKLDKTQNPVEVFKFLCCKYFGLTLEQLNNLQNCNFFEIGGNSILSIQFLAELQEELAAEYPTELVTCLFEQNLKTCLNCLNNFTPQQKRLLIQEEISPTINLKGNKKLKSDIELKISWTYNLEACVDSSPLIFSSSENQTMVALGSFAHIFAVINTRNGREIVKFTLPDAVESRVCLSPCKNRLYVGCFDGKLYCIDYVKNMIIWEYSTGDRIKSTPCLCRNNSAIVFGSYDKYFYCIDINAGQCLWKTFVSSSVVSSPLSDENSNKIYVATISGTCLCLSALNGEILWTYKCGSPIFGSPSYTSIINGYIIWADVHGFIHCLSIDDGELVWKFQAKGNIYSSLINYKDYIIFGCHDHNLYILKTLSTTTAEIFCLVKLNSAISSTPFICDIIINNNNRNRTVIIAASNSGFVYVIELHTGQILAELKLEGEIFSSPSVYNNKIYVGCRDNNLYCIDINLNK